jgi:hypothetical protein
VPVFVPIIKDGALNPTNVTPTALAEDIKLVLLVKPIEFTRRENPVYLDIIQP